MYMRYTQGQNEEYLLSRSMYVLNQDLFTFCRTVIANSDLLNCCVLK